MNLTGTIFKRAGAYILDIIIVSMLVSLLSYIPIINPTRTQYSEKYNELDNLVQQYTNEEISYEEYEEAYIPISYEIYRLNVYYVIIDIVVILLYFGVLPFLANGQTIGKKLFQLKITSNTDKPLTIVNYILRCIVLNNVLISIALQCIVYFMDASSYFTIYQNVNLVGYVILYISLFMVIVRGDNRGLHDFVASTKVVYIGEENAKKEKIIEVEQKVLESEMEIKPKTKAKKTTKSTKTNDKTKTKKENKIK